jgi:hypothetical protein
MLELTTLFSGELLNKTPHLHHTVHNTVDFRISECCLLVPSTYFILFLIKFTGVFVDIALMWKIYLFNFTFITIMKVSFEKDYYWQ